MWHLILVLRSSTDQADSKRGAGRLRLRAGVCGVGLLAWCFALTDCAPNGCPAFDMASQCAAESVRCTDSAHIQTCNTFECKATWATAQSCPKLPKAAQSCPKLPKAAQSCPAVTPFCVKVAPSASVSNAAECAAMPNCAATRACADRGLCGDGPDGFCVLTAAGCAGACQGSGLCGFNGSECIATPDGCANSARCATDGSCAHGARCGVLPRRVRLRRAERDRHGTRAPPADYRRLGSRRVRRALRRGQERG
jgi:hypothetical protein